jgi:hypothetical protein
VLPARRKLGRRLDKRAAIVNDDRRGAGRAEGTDNVRATGFRAVFLAAAAIAGALAPSIADAQIFLTRPNFRPGPIEPSDPLVGVPLPGATAAEYRASLIWNMRAGLNVAALQCQFSAFLRAVPNYNGFLAHHSTELAEAYTVLTGYFKRTLGPVKGVKAFDDFSTITYNNWSTLQAQMGFCQTASDIEKSALATPKGHLIDLAERRMRELRNSLVPAYDPTLAVYNPYMIATSNFPPFGDECWSKKRNELLVRCGGTATS